MNSFILFTPHLYPLPWGEERAVERHLYPHQGEERVLEWHLYPFPMGVERTEEWHFNPLPEG